MEKPKRGRVEGWRKPVLWWEGRQALPPPLFSSLLLPPNRPKRRGHELINSICVFYDVYMHIYYMYVCIYSFMLSICLCHIRVYV